MDKPRYKAHMTPYYKILWKNGPLQYVGWIMLCMVVLAPAYATAKEMRNWSVYYSDQLPPESFLPYDVIVFDADSHPTLRPLTNRGKTLLGYISFGEAETYRPFFKTLQENGMLLKENPNWKGHYVIDLRNPEWTKYIIEKLIPPMIQKGFDGIFIDTMDSPLQLEIDDPKTYTGMKEASARLIHAVRMHYPNLKLMLNRGFEILPEVATSVDMVLAESVMVNYNVDANSASLFPQAEYQSVLDQLKTAQKHAPSLKIFTLDYWPIPKGKRTWGTSEKKAVKRIYETQRAHGFIPYVSTPALDSLLKEP